MVEPLEIFYLILDILIEIEEVLSMFQKEMVPWAQLSVNRAVILLSFKLLFGLRSCLRRTSPFTRSTVVFV